MGVNSFFFKSAGRSICSECMEYSTGLRAIQVWPLKTHAACIWPNRNNVQWTTTTAITLPASLDTERTRNDSPDQRTQCWLLHRATQGINNLLFMMTPTTRPLFSEHSKMLRTWITPRICWENVFDSLSIKRNSCYGNVSSSKPLNSPYWRSTQTLAQAACN